MKIKTIDTLAEINELAATGSLKGVVRVPADAYHAGPGISSTGLKELLKSPAHFRAYLEDDRDTDAMRLGRLAHLKLLEPDVFEATCIYEPQWRHDGRTSAGKVERASFDDAAAGKLRIKAKDAETLRGMENAVMGNELALSILSGGVAELSIYWEDEQTGILCKARADYIKDGKIYDLKTCQDARRKAFQKDVANYRYHLSAAFYVDGFRSVFGTTSFAWLAVEKERPHGIAFYSASDQVLDVGRREYREALNAFARCEQEKVYPSYPQRWHSLALPAWYEEGVEAWSL